MSVTVRIPTPLRSFVKGEREVKVSGSNLRELLANLDSAHSGIGARICDDAGNVRRFVNVFVNDEDIRARDGLDTALGEGDVVSIVPAIAGG